MKFKIKGHEESETVDISVRIDEDGDVSVFANDVYLLAVTCRGTIDLAMGGGEEELELIEMGFKFGAGGLLATE